MRNSRLRESAATPGRRGGVSGWSVPVPLPARHPAFGASEGKGAGPRAPCGAKRRTVVEAAGIEPASENDRRERAYMLSPFNDLDRGLETDEPYAIQLD